MIFLQITKFIELIINKIDVHIIKSDLCTCAGKEVGTI